MAKKPDPLNDLLAKSFSSPAKPAGINPTTPQSAEDQLGQFPAAAEDAPENSNQQGRAGEPVASSKASLLPSDRKPPSQGPSPDFEGVKKTTVSFYATEQAHVDEILDALLKSRRQRGGFSDAVKIALRLCPKNLEEIGRAWDSARAEDRRTQKGKS